MVIQYNAMSLVEKSVVIGCKICYWFSLAWDTCGIPGDEAVDEDRVLPPGIRLAGLAGQRGARVDLFPRTNLEKLTICTA